MAGAGAGSGRMKLRRKFRLEEVDVDDERVRFLFAQMRSELAFFKGDARGVHGLSSKLKAYVAELDGLLDPIDVEELRTCRNEIEQVNAVCIEEGQREPSGLELEDVREAMSHMTALLAAIQPEGDPQGA